MNKHKYALLFVLGLILSNAVQAQSYDEDFFSFEKEQVFHDDFYANVHGWRRYYSKIKKGRYDVETIGKDPAAISTIPIKLDSTRNYEIQATVSIEWNRSNEFMGIVWNKGSRGAYYLGFDKGLKTKLFLQEDQEETKFGKIEYTGALYPQFQKNVITIRKIDDEYLIYINGILIDNIPYERHFGDRIGFFVGAASELRVFDLTVSYLTRKD